MADAITVSGPITGTDRTLSFETGKLAGQADGAVLGRIGDTMILVTATASKSVREGTDFFPLTVDIEERMYAVGKIPGSFFRREGKAPDQAILTDRLIDRPLRPSFPEGSGTRSTWWGRFSVPTSRTPTTSWPSTALRPADAVGDPL